MLNCTAVANSCTPNMKPPSPVMASTRLSGCATLAPERSRKVRAERPLIARGDEGARLVNRKTVPGGKADLRQFISDDCVRRQDLAPDVQLGHLWLNLLDLFKRGR